MSTLKKALDPDMKDHMVSNLGTTTDPSIPIPHSDRYLGYHVPINHFMTTDYVAKHNLGPSLDAFEDTVLHPNKEMVYAGGVGGASDKIAMQHKGHMFILKPFYDNLRTVPVSNGFAELTSQAIYHAANIGHLHQRVFPVATDAGDYIAIHAADSAIHRTASQVNSDLYKPFSAYNPGQSKHHGVVKEKISDYLKMGFIDHLLGNADRHLGNFLINTQNGSPLAIDNSYLFSHNYGQMGGTLNNGLFPFLTPLKKHKDGDKYASISIMEQAHSAFPTELLHVANWWKDNKDKIKESFEHSLSGMHHVGASRLRPIFDSNHKQISDFLDSVAKNKPNFRITERGLDKVAEEHRDTNRPISVLPDKFPEVPKERRKFIPVSDIGPLPKDT